MSERGRTGLRVLAVTNVGPSIVTSYLGPLASLDEVAEVVLVRDVPNVTVRGKLRCVTPPRWLVQSALGKMVGRSWLLRSEVAARVPDLVTTVHWFPDGPGAVRLAARLGVPMVANIVGSRAELVDGGRRLALSRLPSFVRSAAQDFQRDKLNSASAVSFTGSATLEWYRSMGITRPHLSVLHAAIDSTQFRAAEVERDLDVVFIGRVDPDKRVDRLLRVLSCVGHRRPGTRALLVGVDPDHGAWLYASVSATAAGGIRLETVARVPDVASVLRRARVLLVTSDTEGRTLAALEAMACGAVPVVTDVGDLREAMDGGTVGVVVPVAGAEEDLVARLADAVLGLLDDESRRAAMASRATAHVHREHHPDRAQDEWRSILRSVGAGVR